MRIASAYLFIEWSDERPDDLAPALVKLLDGPSPDLRRGAVTLIAAAVVKTDLPDFQAKQPAHPKVDKPPQPSKTAVRFEALKAEERLHKLSEKDSDPTVRAAARVALERFALVRIKDQSR